MGNFSNSDKFLNDIKGRKGEYQYLHGLMIASLIADIPFDMIPIAERMDELNKQFNSRISELENKAQKAQDHEDFK